MANLIVGDIHGCFDELKLLLKQANFNPLYDTLWCTGDLVARGKQSLAVLRYLSRLGKQVRIVLGNHDIHLLAIYAGVSKNREKDNLTELLNAPDCDQLINWLRKQPLIQRDDNLKLLVCHAGLSPDWDLDTAQTCARELSLVLSSDCYPLFLDAMYGDYPDKWHASLQGLEKLRYSVNVLTRMRFCYENGRLELRCKDNPIDAPSNLYPWFTLPCKAVQVGYSIAFGHWAALNGQTQNPSIHALDTGCCWGGELSLLHYETGQLFRQKKLTV